MPDQAAPGLLCIALVFGDEAAAAHVREAMHGHANIVYATSAADFDGARMAGANVAAALVNLDDGDWLDSIETNLDAAGIAVVYNDPEISRGLDGWERARWLRHLLAKLRGSTDVDPPRPEQAGLPSVDESAALEPEAPAPIEAGRAVVERPLSPQEIETMTADFVAERESVSVQVIQPAPQPGVVIVDRPSAADAPADAVDSDGASTQIAPPATTDDAPEPVQIAAVATDASPGGDVEQPNDEASETGVDSDDDLDVDTETLSAMIDAQLADSESRTHPDSREVWRVVEGGAASPVQLDTAGEANSAVPPTAGKPAEQLRVEAVAQDDSDVLASLPSLDDWQLVDPEADLAPEPATAATGDSRGAEAAFSDSFAGLELVPFEVISPVADAREPVERWMSDDKAETPKSRRGNA